MSAHLVSPVTGHAQTGAGAYGRRVHPVTGRPGDFHAGLDIACPAGTAVVAPEPGQVVYAGWAGAHPLTRGRSGLCLILRGTETGRDWYLGHLSAPLAAAGDRVDRGQLIARSGATGNVTGPHVHLEVRTAGTTVTTDPAAFMRRRGVTPGSPPPTPTKEDDDMTPSDRIDLPATSKAAHDALGLDSISVGGALAYAAAGGYRIMSDLPDLVAAIKANTRAVNNLRKAINK